MDVEGNCYVGGVQCSGRKCQCGREMSSFFRSRSVEDVKKEMRSIDHELLEKTKLATFLLNINKVDDKFFLHSESGGGSKACSERSKDRSFMGSSIEDPKTIANSKIGVEAKVVKPVEATTKNRSISIDTDRGDEAFDEVIFNHFAKKSKEDDEHDFLASLRPCTACEKLKKLLCANAEVSFNIECLVQEKDVQEFIKREMFDRNDSSLQNAEQGCQGEEVHQMDFS
ncbi:hypothetical protein SUGI_0188140 [Cryptomeria japonica]|nr:hypothetical protein SUGI_0188140 [Cryptomeria japonica]